MIKSNTPEACRNLADAADAEGLPVTAATLRRKAEHLSAPSHPYNDLAYTFGLHAGAFNPHATLHSSPYRRATSDHGDWIRGYKEGREIRARETAA